MFKTGRFFPKQFYSYFQKEERTRVRIASIRRFLSLFSRGFAFSRTMFLSHRLPAWPILNLVPGLWSWPYVTPSFPGSSLLLPRFREEERGPWEHGGQGPSPSTDQLDHLRVSPRADTFYFSVRFKGAALVKNVWEGGAVWVGTSRYNPDHFNEKVSCYCHLVFEALL